jgi:hydrogenase maturation factor
MTGHGGPGTAAGPGPAPECAGETCLTCADAAVPVRVVRLLGGGLAMADTGAGLEEISVALVSAAVGDTVLVHAGEALAVLGGEHDDRAGG